MIERRRHQRVATDEPARILIDSRATLRCTLRNVSLGGACLELDPSVAVPQTFDLIPHTSDAHVCRVVWRRDRRMGVAFVN
jgi:hypothetical protein